MPATRSTRARVSDGPVGTPSRLNVEGPLSTSAMRELTSPQGHPHTLSGTVSNTVPSSGGTSPPSSSTGNIGNRRAFPSGYPVPNSLVHNVGAPGTCPYMMRSNPAGPRSGVNPGTSIPPVPGGRASSHHRFPGISVTLHAGPPPPPHHSTLNPSIARPGSEPQFFNHWGAPPPPPNSSVSGMPDHSGPQLMRQQIHVPGNRDRAVSQPLTNPPINSPSRNLLGSALGPGPGQMSAPSWGMGTNEMEENGNSPGLASSVSLPRAPPEYAFAVGSSMIPNSGENSVRVSRPRGRRMTATTRSQSRRRKASNEDNCDNSNNTNDVSPLLGAGSTDDNRNKSEVFPDATKSLDNSKVLIDSKKAKGPNGENISCVICLDEIPHMQLAAVNGCAHSFCFSCIEKWSDRENTCPLCKLRFTKIDRVNKPPPTRKKRKAGENTLPRCKNTKKVKNRDQRADLSGGSALQGLLANIGASSEMSHQIASFIFSSIPGSMGNSMMMSVNANQANGGNNQQNQFPSSASGTPGLVVHPNPVMEGLPLRGVRVPARGYPGPLHFELGESSGNGSHFGGLVHPETYGNAAMGGIRRMPRLQDLNNSDVLENDNDDDSVEDHGSFVQRVRNLSRERAAVLQRYHYETGGNLPARSYALNSHEEDAGESADTALEIEDSSDEADGTNVEVVSFDVA